MGSSSLRVTFGSIPVAFSSQTRSMMRLVATLGLFIVVNGGEVNGTASDNTCSSNIGYCGKGYQACCITYGAEGYPCGCHLRDGTGSSIGDCGTCGASYQLCCDGFKATGNACFCDVTDGFAV